MSQENNQQVVNDEEVRRIAYESASDACNDLDSKVPIGLAKEQIFFNRTLRATLFDVDSFVMKELHYDSVDDLCKAFAKEQIDAIATAIYNWRKTGNAIIISDQTGLGKGRIVAGLIRWSILELGEYPVFFTEKKNLFSDIYRDLFDIGLDAGIPIKLKTRPIQVSDSELTDEVILNQIKIDIKEGELRVDFDLPEDVELNNKILDNDEIIDELIELYREFILENGLIQGTGYEKVQEKLSDKEAKKLIQFDIESINTIRFYELPTNYNLSKLMNDDKMLSKVIDAYKSNLSLKDMENSASKEKRMRVNPFCPFDIKIKNKQGDILYEVSQSDYKAFISSNRIPAKYEKGLMLMLYTTLQRGIMKDDGSVEKKGQFVFKHTDKKVVILDESHNSAGQSKRNQIMTMILRNAKYVSYVSATWAKRPDNMPIYAIRTAIKDSFLSNSQLINAFQTGGLALQEAVSSALVQDGQLVRREKEYEGEVIYYQEDDTTSIGLNQVNKLNRVADTWNRIQEFQKEVANEFYTCRSTFIRNAPLGVPIDEYRKQFKFAGRVNRFAFQLFNYFLLGLKVRQTAEECINQLKDGKKVVIAIANTLESAFDNIKPNYLESEGYNIGDVVTNDFSEVLKFILSKTMRFKFQGESVNDSGEPVTIDLKFNVLDQLSPADFSEFSNADEVFSLYETMRIRLIDQFERIINNIMPIGISLSPMDEIISIVQSQKENFTIDEITGRTKKLDFQNENYDEGTIVKRDKTDKMDIINRFNSNELDAVIINQSGSTGLSLHAIPTIVQGKIVPPVDVIPNPPIPPKSLLPKNEVKQRCMLIMQMELNISTEVQKLGRINRNGQVFPPIYKYITSAIPSEARLNAMMQRKLQSLMATTAGSQEYGKDVFDYDDFFSEYTIDVWNEVVRDLNFPSDFKVQNVKDIYNNTKLLYFMDYDSQKNFYFMLSERLRRRIAELKERGQYFAAIQYQDYKATTTDIIPYIIGNNESISQFGKHTYAELCDVTTYDRKNTETSITKEMIAAMTLKENGENVVFNDLSSYQNKLIQMSETLVTEYNALTDNIINRYKEEATATKNQLDEVNAQISKMPSLEEVINLEQTISEKTKEKNDLTKTIVAKIEEGEDSSKESKLVQQLKGELDKLNATLGKKISGYEDSSGFKEAHKNAHRAVKSLSDDLERSQSRIERQEQIKQEQIEIKDLFVALVQNLGGVYHYKILEEQSVLDDDFNTSYNYVETQDGDGVLSSIRFNFDGNNHFTLSEITIRFIGVSSEMDFALSEIYKKISESELEKGKKHTAYIENKKVGYKNYWDGYIKDIDTSQRGKRVMLSGDLLRGLAMNQLAELGGNIVKYSTDENKLKISLELNEASANAVMPRFNEDVNYSVMFGLSQDNIARIVPTMIANIIFKKREFIPTYSGYKNIVISSQILYDQSNVFLTISIDKNANVLREIGSFCDKFTSENTNIDEDSVEGKGIYQMFMQKMSQIVAKNLQSFRFALQTSSESFVAAFSSICQNMSFDLINNDSPFKDGFMMLDEGDISKSYSVIVAEEAKSGYFSNSRLALTRPLGDINELKKFTLLQDDDLLKGTYIISRELIESRASTPRNAYFVPLYNLVLTYDALLEIISFMKAKYTELIAVTSSECLSFAEPRYTFDLQSSTTGLIDNVAGVTQVDGVGDAKIEQINDILNEWLELYNA